MVISAVVVAVVVFVVQRNVFHLSFIVAAHVRLSDQYGIFMHQRAVDFFPVILTHTD